MEEKRYQIQAEIRSGVTLPDSEEYKVRISIGELSWETDKPKQGVNQKMKNYAKWNQRISEQFTSVHQHLATFPTVFIYLIDSSNRPICFYKASCMEFTDKNAPAQWAKFEPDLAIGKVKKLHKSGIFQFRLYLHETHKDGVFDPDSVQSWKEKLPKRGNPYHIRAYIYQAENLPPCDESGASDPYVEVWTPDEQNCRTSVVEQTNNPLYYETKDFDIEFSTLDDAPPIILNVFDTDDVSVFSLGTDADDYIGRAIIFLHEIDDLAEDDHIPEPKWYPVKYSMISPWDEKSGAKLLVSFAKLEFHDEFAVPAEAVTLNKQFYADEIQSIPIEMPDLKIDQFNIDINVLGLRNLVSTGLLPVKKAFTKFSVKSILPPAQAKAVADIYTQPGEGGTDPNVRVTLKIQVKIPGEIFYCPSMTCSIQDKLYFDGMRQPILGTFTLKLGQILSDTRNLDKEEFANQEFFNKILTKAIGLKKGASAHRTMGEILDDLQNNGLQKSKTFRKGGGGADDAGSQISLYDVKVSEIDPEEMAKMTPRELEDHQKA